MAATDSLGGMGSSIARRLEDKLEGRASSDNVVVVVIVIVIVIVVVRISFGQCKWFRSGTAIGTAEGRAIA